MTWLTLSEWKAVYREWKDRHPQWAGEDYKEFRRRLVRGCAKKAIYSHSAEAWKVARDLPRREGFAPHVYRCQLCKSLHIGNTPEHRLTPAERILLAGPTPPAQTHSARSEAPTSDTPKRNRMA